MKSKSNDTTIINIILVGFMFVLFSSCHFYRSISKNFPDIKDYDYFSSRTIKSDDKAFSFYNGIKNDSLAQQIIITPRGREHLKNPKQTLDKFIDSSGTIAMMIIRNDSILFERYAKGYHSESLFNTFSVVKSMIYCLVGIAIEDGLIASINDPITTYLPELKTKKGFDRITIKHLLQMKSGIKETKHPGLPSSDPLRFYYGRNLDKECLKLKIKSPSGGDFLYSYNSSTQLIGMILTRVTKKNLSAYFEEKIWSKMGTASNAFWNLDKKNGMEKAFCCLNAHIVDFAKFGRLILQEGHWEGEQLVPKQWISQITNDLDEEKFKTAASRKNDDMFNLHWWLGTKGHGDFKASGLYGQYIHVFPKHAIIMLTFTERTGLTQGIYEVDMYYEILDQL